MTRPQLAAALLAVLVFASAPRVMASLDFLGEEWATEDYAQAAAAAKASNRLLIIKFTGSDWCGPCQAMSAEVLEKDDFQGWAEDNVVFLYVDFPQGRALPEAIRAQNEQLSLKFSAEGFPTVVVYDLANKKELDRSVGFGPGSGAQLLAKWKKIVADQSKPKAIPVPEGEAKVAAEWLEGDAPKRERLKDLPATPPSLEKLTGWTDGKAINLADLKGKVVVLDFWSTWSAPSVSSLAAKKAMYEKYKALGVEFIGVCHKQGADQAAELIKKHGMSYPMAIDSTGEVFSAYRVNGVPDYYLIDRAGKLRIADVRNETLRGALKALAREPAPGAAPASNPAPASKP